MDKRPFLMKEAKGEKKKTSSTELIESTLTSRRPAMWTTFWLSSLANNLMKEERKIMIKGRRKPESGTLWFIINTSILVHSDEDITEKVL